MEKILTLHPQGKKKVNISKIKYGLIRNAVIESLKNDTLSFSLLVDFREK